MFLNFPKSFSFLENSGILDKDCIKLRKMWGMKKLALDRENNSEIV